MPYTPNRHIGNVISKLHNLLQNANTQQVYSYYSAGLTVGSVRLVTLSYPEIISPF
jgi:hypothetical protein